MVLKPLSILNTGGKVPNLLLPWMSSIDKHDIVEENSGSTWEINETDVSFQFALMFAMGTDLFGWFGSEPSHSGVCKTNNWPHPYPSAHWPFHFYLFRSSLQAWISPSKDYRSVELLKSVDEGFDHQWGRTDEDPKPLSWPEIHRGWGKELPSLDYYRWGNHTLFSHLRFDLLQNDFLECLRDLSSIWGPKRLWITWYVEKYVCPSQVVRSFHPSKISHILCMFKVLARTYIQNTYIYILYADLNTQLSGFAYKKKGVNKCHLVGSVSVANLDALACLYPLTIHLHINHMSINISEMNVSWCVYIHAGFSTTCLFFCELIRPDFFYTWNISFQGLVILPTNLPHTIFLGKLPSFLNLN